MKHLANRKQHPTINRFLIQKTFNAIAVLITLFCFNNAFAQYKIPETPKFQTSVYDYINLLSPSQKNSLENKLIKYSDTTSTQIVVAIISSTNGDYINALGTNWAHKWGIGGDKDKDNGIFILLAKDDRKINISTGYGVEHLMTDAMSKRIIERDIIPYFKQGDYYSGLNKGVNSIFEVMTGEYKGTRQSSSSNEGIPFGLIFLFIIFIIILISISKNRRGGGGSGGRRFRNDPSRSILETIILSNAGRSSSGGGFGGGFGSGSSGGGGGFGGGFGGGGFGGGGASGGW